MDVEAEIANLSRRVGALETEAQGQHRLNARTVAILTEVKEDVAILRRHAIATGQKVEELESHIDKMDARLAAVESGVAAVRTDMASLRRDLPSIVAEAMREVMRESKG